MKFRLTAILKMIENTQNENSFINVFSDDPVAYSDAYTKPEERNIKLLNESIWVEIFIFLQKHRFNWGKYITSRMVNIIKNYDSAVQESFHIKLNRVELFYSNLVMILYVLRMWRSIHFFDVGKIYVSINDFTHGFFRGKTTNLKYITFENLYIYLSEIKDCSFNYNTAKEVLNAYDIQPEAYALYRLLISTGLIDSLETIEFLGRTNINVIHFHRLIRK